MSWVFLTDRFAYKLKKPMCHPLIDLSTLDAREANAKEEVRLNRRLAQCTYLGIIPLTEGPLGQLRFDGCGNLVDWLVQMRRLPACLMLDSLLDRRVLPAVRLRALAGQLAHFYDEAPRVRLSGLDYRQRLSAEMLVTRDVLLDSDSKLPRDRIESLHARMCAYLEKHEELLDTRAEEGYLVEGHGDLRPEHVCLLSHPVVFDCLEFSERLRQVDPLDDLAFLAIGGDLLGCSHVGRVLYDAYHCRSADSPPSGLVEFYCSFRSGMRARLAAAHLSRVPATARNVWLERALSFLHIAECHASAMR